MCLIAVAPAGTKKYSKFFLEAIEKASVKNSDGIGYSFKRARNLEKVWISKGFSDVDKFISSLKNKRLKDEDELIVHLRIGNRGSKSTEMNHPFVLSNKPDEILSNNVYVKASTLCHNGTFYDYSVTNSNMSDTYFFVKDFMAVKEVQELLKRDVELFKGTFKYILKTNKLAMIFNDETPLITIGEYLTDEGYLFSNESYKNAAYRNVGGREYRNGEEYWNGISDEVGRVQRQIPDRTPSGTNSRMGSMLNSPSDAEQRYNREKAIAAFEKDIINRPRIGDNSVRDHAHLLSVDPKTDILDNGKGLPVQNFNTFQLLYPVFENYLYVPRKYIRSQFKSSKFMPTEFNYKHYTLMCTRGNQDQNLVRNVVYEITAFDNTSKGLHIITPLNTKDFTKRACIVNTDLIKSFDIYYKEFTPDYELLFKLIQKYPTPSKNLHQKLDKIISTSKRKGKDTNITFKQVGGLSLMSLKLFKNYINEIIYRDAGQSVILANRETVQKTEIWVN